MGKIDFSDHSVFKNIKEPSVTTDSDGLERRCDKNKPIGDNTIFKKLGVYVDALIKDKNLSIRRKDLRGSYTWQPSDIRLGGATLIKLCHYAEDDYFWGVREGWAELNNVRDKIIKFCSYRFVVPPQIKVNFIGFPCLASADLDKIRDIINTFPSAPNF